MQATSCCSNCLLLSSVGLLVPTVKKVSCLSHVREQNHIPLQAEEMRHQWLCWCSPPQVVPRAWLSLGSGLVWGDRVLLSAVSRRASVRAVLVRWELTFWDLMGLCIEPISTGKIGSRILHPQLHAALGPHQAKRTRTVPPWDTGEVLTSAWWGKDESCGPVPWSAMSTGCSQLSGEGRKWPQVAHHRLLGRRRTAVSPGYLRGQSY